MMRAEQYAVREYYPIYDRCLRLWRGQHFKNMSLPQNEERVVVNHIAPIVQTMVDSIAFNPVPDIIIKPLTEMSEPKALIATQAVKYEWRKAAAARETKRSLFDQKCFGFGICQTGWEFITDELEMTDGRERVEGEPPSAEDLTAAVEAGLPLDSDPPIPAPRVRKDQFWVRRLCPRDFRIDPEATWVIEDAAYLGYTEEVPLAVLKQDKRYKNTRQLTGKSANLEAYLSDELQRKTDDEKPNDVKRVKLHHYYEKRRRLHLVFCEEHDKPLLAEYWRWKADRYPFRTLRAPGTQDSFYPEEPLPILLEPMQREINEIRSDMHVHRRRFKRKYVATSKTLDSSVKKQLRSGADGLVIEVNHPNPREAVVPLEDAPLNPEVYKADQVAHQDIITVSGIDQYELGMTPSKRLTTTEVNAIQSSGGARVQADAQAFEEFCAGIAHDCLDWLMQYSDRVQELPIYGPDDQIQEWGKFSARDIIGDYLVEVYMGSTQVRDSATTVKDIGFLLQTMQPYTMPTPAGPPLVNAKPLLRQMLKAVPEIKQVNEIIPPDPVLPPGMPPGMGGPPMGPPGVPPGAGAPPAGLPPGGPAPNLPLGGPDPMAMIAALRAGAMNGNGAR
jgi:hypothetical protein